MSRYFSAEETWIIHLSPSNINSIQDIQRQVRTKEPKMEVKPLNLSEIHNSSKKFTIIITNYPRKIIERFYQNR